MADYKTEALTYLAKVRDETGKSLSELARLADVNQTTFTRPMNSAEHKYAVKFQALMSLADRTGIPLPESLIASRDNGRSPPKHIELPIRFEVAASGFLTRDELRQEPFGSRTVQSYPPYEDDPQWLERVVSDSMDRLIPPGSLLHVVDAIAIRYRPKNGHVVVVERVRFQGLMIERTVKQVELTTEGVRLWPRSHNPRWQEPIDLTSDLDASEQETDATSVRIAALALRAVQDFL